MTTSSTSANAFVENQLITLKAAVSQIIPSDGEMPSAGDAGVPQHIDKTVGKSKSLKRLFNHGLAQIEIQAVKAFSKPFSELTGEQKDSLLRDVESTQPDFFDSLVKHTYNGYYTNFRVIASLGLEVRPPQPLGYRVETGNLNLIENVKRRGKKYRDA